MDKQPPAPGESRSNTGRLVGATSNKDIVATQQGCRHKLIHHDATTAATKDMTQDAHWKIVHKTGCGRLKQPHPVGPNNIQIEANGGQLIIQRTGCLGRELHHEDIASHNRKPLWLTQAYVYTACETKHHDVVSSGIFTDEVPDKDPIEWTKQASVTLEEAREVCITEVTAKHQYYKQQPMSCRLSTCLKLWPGKEAGYSWNSPTCAWGWKWPKCPKKARCAPQYRKCTI